MLIIQHRGHLWRRPPGIGCVWLSPHSFSIESHHVPGTSWAQGCHPEQGTQSVAPWSIMVWTFFSSYWALGPGKCFTRVSISDIQMREERHWEVVPCPGHRAGQCSWALRPDRLAAERTSLPAVLSHLGALLERLGSQPPHHLKKHLLIFKIIVK